MALSRGCLWAYLLVLYLCLIPNVLALVIPASKYPDLYEASIEELQDGLDSGDFTSVDLVKAYLARIDEVNLQGPQLRAILETNSHAVEQAAALDAERQLTGKRGPLHGIPILLKDNIATLASDGMNTTAGSYALLGSVVPRDATVAAKLRKAGAILLGKTNLSEWSQARSSSCPLGWSGRGGQTTNPYYPGANPCGSSSGSGVATAIGLAAASLGSETDGSITCPSSFNNIAGIKPTVGLTSRAGVIPISMNQDTIGPMTRSIADAAAVLSVIAGRDEADNFTSTAPVDIPDYTQFLDVKAIKGKRFGVPRLNTFDMSEVEVPSVIVAKFNRTLDVIRSLGGIIVDPAPLPSAQEVLHSNESWVARVELKVGINAYIRDLKSVPTGVHSLADVIAFNNAHKDLEEPEGYTQSILMIAQGTNGYNSTYHAALRANHEISRERGIDAALKAHNLDALLAPSLNAIVSAAAMAGYPIVTVPLGFFPEDTKPETGGIGGPTFYPAPGVPFGLSFFGTAYSEPSLIGFAYAYEQHTRTRLLRRAYKEAIPVTQLADVIHLARTIQSLGSSDSSQAIIAGNLRGTHAGRPSFPSSPELPALGSNDEVQGLHLTTIFQSSLDKIYSMSRLGVSFEAVPTRLVAILRTMHGVGQTRPFVAVASLLPKGALSFLSRAPAPEYPDLYEASIQELQSGLDNHQYTSVDLVKAYLARIDEVNLKGPKLRAVIETNPQALEQAAALDKERKKSGKRSALHGIPILLKDNIATLASEGMNTTAGSYALLKSIVPGDATVAAKLRKAGAILLGKANLSEWSGFRGKQMASGWSARGGQTTSPYYPGAYPCGSSSGSGVATAIGLAAGALGTETDGSIICPSSHNNLVGIKPTVGLTSRAGVIPISSHRDSVGPMTRNVADAAVILSAIAGRDNADNYTSTAPAKIPDYTTFLKADAIRGKRFGVPRTVFTNDSITGNHPSINAEFDKALDMIRSLGGIVVDPADLPSATEIPEIEDFLVLKVDFKVGLNSYLNNLRSIPSGASTLAKLIAYNNAHEDLELPNGYEDQSTFIESEMTPGYNPAYYAALRDNYAVGRERGIDAALKAYNLDALLLPSNGLSTTPAAVAGYPIVTVPLGFHPNDTEVMLERTWPNTAFPAPGMPFGLSFLGTAYSEPSLIGFAYAYEQRTHTRLQKKAYKEAIPLTQLNNVLR